MNSGAMERPGDFLGQQSQSTEAVLEFLTLASIEMDLQIDRAELRRVIGGLNSDQHGESFDLEDYTAKLIATGPSLKIRIDHLKISPEEAGHLVRYGAPVGAVWCNAGGELSWLLLVDHGDGRIQLVDSNANGDFRRSSVKAMRSLLESATGTVQWLSLQSCYPCSALASEDHHERKPLARYMTLLAPEKSDIAVILVFALFVGVLALSTPIAIEALVNTVAFGQFVQPVIVLAAILFVFMAFSACLRAVQTYVAEIIQRRLFVRVTADLAYRIPRVQADFWKTHYGPELVNRYFEMVTVQKVTTQLLLDGTSLVLQTIVGMIVIAFYHPVFLGFDAFLILLMAVIVFFLGRNAVATSIDESRQKYKTASWLEELARHPTLFRSRGGLAFALDRADRFVTEYLIARASHFRILIRQIVCALFVQALASTVLLGLGGWLVINGQLTLGQLVAAELIVTLIVGSFAKIGKHLEGFYDVMASMDKLGHLLDMPLERIDGIELPRTESGILVRIHNGPHASDATNHSAESTAITIKPGQKWAIVAESLAGRAELLEGLAGYQTSIYGQVEVDGHDIRRLRLDSLRAQVVLLRDIEVFAGTIAENLHIGRSEVSESDMRNSLQSISLLDDMLNLPDGLASTVQTNGAPFCSDQVVQLMIARGLAGHPRLLIVDGLLDKLTDHALRKVMPGLLEPGYDVTVIIGTGRQDVLAYFERQLKLSLDGTLTISPLGSPTAQEL